MHQPGQVSWCAKASPPGTSPPQGPPRTKADTLAQTLWYSIWWCNVLVGVKLYLRVKSFYILSGATDSGSTFSKPMLPPPLHASVAQVENHSHPH